VVPDPEGYGMSDPRGPGAPDPRASGPVGHGSPEPLYGPPEPAVYGSPEPAYGRPEPRAHSGSEAYSPPDPTVHSAPAGASAHHAPDPGGARSAPPVVALPADPGSRPGAAHPAAPRDDRPPLPAPVPLTLAPPRRRGRIGRFHVGQIVVVQLAAAVALAAYPQPDVVFLPVLGVCLAVAAATLAPRGHRWWYEDVPRRWALRRRRRRRPPTGVDPRLAALAPGLVIEEITDRGLQIGIGMDSDGWYAALAVGDPAGGPARPDRLVQLLSQASAPVSALQVVHHTVPAPTMVSPAGEQTWVGMRLAAADAPVESASRGGGVEGAHRAIAAAVGRIGRTLRASGYTTHVLTAQELVAAIAAVGGWDPTRPTTGVRGQPEQWNGWRGADAAHICFRVSGRLVMPELYESLSGTRAMSATVSVRFPPAPEPAAEGTPAPAGAPVLHGLLRVATGDGIVDATADEVSEGARRRGLALRRLDGQHGPAVYACAPTAAELR
jgi:type VII secretion protein EccE